MLRRLWNYIKALLAYAVDKLENPGLDFITPRLDMSEVHRRNRERAVAAITRKNNLQQMVDDLQKKTDMLQAKVELAESSADVDRAIQLRDELASKQQELSATHELLQQAIDTSEQVKIAIRREEERFRSGTGEDQAVGQIKREIQRG